jgi:lysozyme family protein
MTDLFPAAVKLILEEEGVLSDRRDDLGGLTKYGISQKAYPHLDIRSLTIEQAKGIYLADYWLECGCDQMPWWAALIVFDCAVNQGPSIAKRFIQKTVRAFQDGVIGPKTLSLINLKDPMVGITRFQGYRGVRYADTATFVRNGLGWMTRLAKVSILASQELPNG